jgi:hypothetical protein
VVLRCDFDGERRSSSLPRSISGVFDELGSSKNRKEKIQEKIRDNRAEFETFIELWRIRINFV